MVKAVNKTIITDVTTNKLYPAYKTKKGTVIQLNSKKTGLPSGRTLSSLVKFVDASGLKKIIITGGYEAKGHSKNSFHGKNLAIDVAGKRFNKLTNAKVRSSARKAGFTHGVYENFKGTSKDHWHLQVGAGNGLGTKESLKLYPLTTKNY